MRDLSPCCQWWRIASIYLDHGLLSRNAPQTTKFIEIWIEMGIFWFEKKTRNLLLSVLPMAEYIVIIKSPQSGVTLCFQFVSAAASASAAAAMTFASHFKSQGYGCDIDKQKFACLQDKVRTIQPNHYKTWWLYPLAHAYHLIRFCPSCLHWLLTWVAVELIHAGHAWSPPGIIFKMTRRLVEFWKSLNHNST